jgi:DNA uptake protein ComE-like DNA-binding protein
MRLKAKPNHDGGRARQRASVLIIVLWICIGLVTIALYFANSMTYELRAADNRVSGIAADQAIEGAARYVRYQLQSYTTNGMSMLPDSTQFPCENVAIGDAHFWIIGRDPESASSTEPYFGLVDEAGKLNLNYANTNALSYLPNMTLDFAQAIADWRGTNGMSTLDYASSGYTEKNAPFESVDELRLVSGADLNLLAGDDINRNGVLDANEKDTAGSGQVNSGLFEYTTVYTREPNFRSDGTTLTNLVDVNTASRAKLQSVLTAANVSTSFITALTNGRPYAGILAVAVRCRQAGMSDADFAGIYTNISTTNATYIRGRVNVNTASQTVLMALFEGLNNGDQTTAESDAQTLITYREQNTNNMNSIAWVYDALGTGNSTLRLLERGDYLTTHSYQITADIAAVGGFGRGYRRVKFVFDVSDGTPKILYRQDLSRLGWALGGKVRQNLLANNSP